MPSEKSFGKCPAFPDDVPVAQLPRISLAKLVSQDEDESRELFHACNAVGFFLLDFQGTSEGEAFIQEAEKIFELNEEIHALDYEEKMKHAFKPPADLFGYKCAGFTKIESGAPDRVEFYNVSQDDMVGNIPARSNPAVVEVNRPLLNSYMRQAYTMVVLILSHIEKHLHLPPGTLASLQPQTKPSGTSLRLLRYAPQAANDRRTSLLGHTDIGTVTILFNVLGGLQILKPDADPAAEENWMWVKPQPNCAIVSLGDAMVEWSGGILRSNMHRVTHGPGPQAECVRYSAAYLARPALDVPMRRVGGGNVIPPLEEGEEDVGYSAMEWEVLKAKAITSGRDNARSRGGRPIEIAA